MTTKKYSKDNLVIIWKPEICIHSGICARGLPQVFNPTVRPWVNTQSATQNRIIDQVKKCPSGALTYEVQNENLSDMENQEPNTRITVSNKGPYLIKGRFLFVDQNGKEEIREGNIALCRCGVSKNKPFCDGGHKQTTVLES